MDATVHYATQGASRADATLKGGVHGIEAPPAPRAIDVSWEGAVAGDLRAGVDVKQARLAIGPLVGGVKGTFKRFDDGFRVDLAWNAGPSAVRRLRHAPRARQPFDIV